jgi:ketosteroid isomerase-like protein
VIGDPVESARRGYEEFNAGEFEAMAARMAPEFEWHEAREVAGPKSYESRDDFLRFVRGFELLWEEFRFEPLELVPAESGAVLYAEVRARGRGKASAEDVEFVIHHVWRLRDGLFVRMDAYLDEAEARTAAGV